MGDTSRFNQARVALAKFVAPRVRNPQREIWPFGDGSYSGYRLMLARRLPELRLDPYGLALAAETSVWANACIQLRCDTVAGMPWSIYDANGNVLENTPFHAMMKYARVTYQQNLFYLWEQSLSVHGETYMEKLWNEDIPGFGIPGGLRILNAIAITPQVLTGAIRWYQYNASGGQYRLEVSDLFVHRYTSLTDDYRASAPMIRAMDGVGIKRSMQSFMRGTYDNDATPGGLVTPKAGVSAGTEFVKRVMKNWAEAFKGTNNANTTGFLPDPVDYVQFERKMPEHQKELSDDQIQEICAAFDVPVDLVKPGGNKDPLGGGGKMNSSRAMFMESFAESECKDIDTFINDVILPWLMPNTGARIEHDFDEIRALIRDTKERSDKIRAEFDGGNITFNEMREALGYEKEPNGDFYKFLPNVVIVQREQLGNVAALIAAAAPQPPTPPAPTPAPLPPPPSQPQLPATTPDAATKSAAVMLNIGNHPDLVGLQAKTRSYVGDTPVKWSDPASFHVTLASMPVVDDEQMGALQDALKDVDVADMPLKVGSLNTFDNLDSHAIHFRVRKSVDLLDLQEQIHDLINGLGIPMSSFSAPEAYKPHITMGYADSKPPARTFDSKVTVKPTALHLGVGDDIVYQKPIGDVITPEDKPAKEEDKKPVKAVTNPSEIADNALLNIIALSKDADENHGYVMDDGELYEFVAGTLWRMGIVEKDMMWDETLRDRIYKLIEKPRSSKSQESPVTTESPTKSYSESALEELGKWEKKVKAKGVKAAFQTYQIPARIADITREALDSVDDMHIARVIFDCAKSAIELSTMPDDDTMIQAAFTIARVAVKSYDTTRAEFVQEMLSIIGPAQSDDSTRRQFAGAMRSALRRYGLIAFRDGMNSVGYDPESFNQKELATFRGWQDEQSTYVTGLGAEVFKQGITEKEVAIRAQMWADVSLRSIFVQGVAAGDSTQNMKWRLGTVENHCPDCVVLDGQIHPAEEWVTKGITPGSGKTVCKQGCDCDLVNTDEPARGNWLVGASKSADGHEHTHEGETS